MTTTSTANEGSHNSNESSHHVQQQQFEIMDHDGDDDAPSNSRRPRQNNNNNKLSNTDACISLGKAIMGAGSFVLPWSFSQMGYIGGPIFLSVLCLMSVHSIQLLSSCALHIKTNNNNNNNRSIAAQSYVDIARSTFGNSGSKYTFVASMASSIGVCGSYLIFIASNLQSLIETTTTTTTSSTTTLIWLLLPVVILLSSVRDMKHFSFASLLGDISVMLGMVVVLVYGYTNNIHTMKENKATVNIDDDHHQHISLVALGSISNMAVAFGSIGYLFLVHFLVIPIQSNMIYPHQFSTKVVPITFGVCAFSSTVFGLMGYIMFQEPQQIVLLNITKGSFFIASVKLLLCVDLIFTYPVVMRPSIVIIEEFIVNCKKQIQHNQQKKDGEEENEDDHHSSDSRDKDQQHLLQQQQQQQHGDNTKNSTTITTNITDIVDYKTHMVVCMLLGIVAASASTVIPAFGLLSGLVGGVSQTFLAFVMPPLMYGKQNCQQSSHSQQQQQQQQQQAQQESILDLFVHRLAWKEKSLVISGFILIVWTLHSTWNEH
jgi:proton-coupled amino acid transporter